MSRICLIALLCAVLFAGGAVLAGKKVIPDVRDTDWSGAEVFKGKKFIYMGALLLLQMFLMPYLRIDAIKKRGKMKIFLSYLKQREESILILVW